MPKKKNISLYGHGNDALDSIKGYVMEYTGGNYDFQTEKHNKIFFIDDSVQQKAMLETNKKIERFFLMQ